MSLLVTCLFVLGLCAAPGVHDAPDDSWLVSYEPQQQQQQQRAVRRQSSSKGQLQAIPSLSSWQTPAAAAAAAAAPALPGPHPPSRIGKGARVKPTRASAQGTSSQDSGAGSEGSGVIGTASSGRGGRAAGSNGSSSRMHALLDGFEQGVTPSLLDLAEL
jgi:hypothetical protein